MAMGVIDKLVPTEDFGALKPPLPLLLSPKEKPYTLDNYVPFEPFFRTHMPKQITLQTGRQVSKCGDVNSSVIMADGTSKRTGNIEVGDMVLSLCRDGVFRPRLVEAVALAGEREMLRIVTDSKASARISRDHRLRVRNGNIDGYIAAKFIYRGDLLAVRNPRTGKLDWENVRHIGRDGSAETVDFHVAQEENFLLDRIVSHNSTSLAAQTL